MEFGQLIVHKMRNMKNHTQNVVVIQFIFIVCQVEGYQNILKPSCTPLTFDSFKAFLEYKERPATSPPPSLSASFLKNNFFLVRFYQLTKFNCLLLFTL